MDIEAFDKPNFCVGDDEEHLNFKRLTSFDKNTLHSHFRQDFESEDDDNVPLIAWFPKKRDTITLPVKRVSDNNSSLNGLMKKSKVSPTAYDDDDDDDVPAMSTDKSFSSLKKELAFVEKSFEDCQRTTQIEKERLHSIKRDIEECSKELENKKKKISHVGRMNEAHKKMQGKIEECVKDFVAKDGQLYLVEELIRERKQELNTKDMELRQVMDNISKQKEFESQVKELLNDLASKQKHLESRIEELESKEKQLDGRVEEHESKQREFESQVKGLESKKRNLGMQVEDLKSQERQLKGQVKELESEKKQLDVQVKGLEPKEGEFEGWVKKLESEKKHFKSQLKELESKEKKFDGQVKEFQSKEEEFNSQVKEFKTKKEEFKGRVKKLKSKKKQFKIKVEYFKSIAKQFEERWKELESKENKFKVLVKSLKLKEKQVEGEAEDPESKLNKHDGTPKEPELTKKQYEPLIKYFDEEIESATCYMDDQLSPTTDETSMQLLPSDETDILVDLQESSDPAKVVLDIILNPIIPRCKKGDHAVIIDASNIILLEQLMKISPSPKINPCVKKDALKLALDLKVNMKENTENSLVVLGFLLLLSIYELLTSFDEDEVLELFALVAQHKIAVDLFRTLGFANKLSDFVENLIRKKQFDVLVTWLRRIKKFLC